MDLSSGGEEGGEAAENAPATSTDTGPSHARKKRATASTAARTLLKQHKYLDDERTDLSSLAIALTKIATQLRKNKMTAKHGEAIQAISTLVEDVVVDGLADRIATMVAASVEAKLSESYDKLTNTASVFSQNTTISADKASETQQALEKLTGDLEKVGKSLADSSTALAFGTMDRQLSETLSGTTGGGRRAAATQGMGGAKTSYADAIRSTPVEHVDAITRTELTRRQVIMRRDPDAGGDAFANLTERELVMKPSQKQI